jgi:NADPH:quinone reductase-like Zn-dependent oxidoreductase
MSNFWGVPPEKIAEVYGMLATKVSDGTLTVNVEKVYPFRDIGQALAHAAQPARSGKILLHFATD